MLYAVIPAGGSGTRLWPLSRADRPKFLTPLAGISQLGSAASLLQATARRLAPLAPAERTYVVTGVAHAAAVARQLPGLPEPHILVEPSPRDSCAAIGLAAAVIARRDPAAVMGSFAADHLVTDGDRFHEVVREAVVGAEQGLLMTVGITPTRPETGYGYLQCGEAVGGPGGGGRMRRVEEFKEKPGHDEAAAYLESGRYLWNASIFVWRVDVFLDELARQRPQLHAGLVAIADAWDTQRRAAVLAEVWPTLAKVSVDYAVMEGAAGAGRVGTVPGDFGWNDVGDFHTLGAALPGNGGGNVVVGAPDGVGGGPEGLGGGKVAGGGPEGLGGGSVEEKPGLLLHDATGLVVVPHSGRMVAALGVRDLIVVDTPDVVLVCPRERAQEVKKLVDELKERGAHAYL